MKTLKILLLLISFMPLLILFLLVMPFGIIGALAKGVMDWVEKQINMINREINDIARRP